MTITVIIPCYNVAPYLSRCLNSLLAQQYDALEVIVVDDGSSDGTVQEVSSWMATHALPITLIEQSNAGASAARNAGLRKAMGHYVQFLDADDELLPGKLAHQARLVTQQGHSELLLGSGRMVDSEGRRIRTMAQRPGTRDAWLDLMEHRMSITSCNLWKRQAVLDAGGWDEDLGSSQEYDLMFRMLQNGARILYDEQELTVVHQRSGGSISQTNLRANWQRYVDLRARIVAHVAGLEDGRSMQPYLQVLYDNIRVLYQHDPTAGLAAHRDLLPAGFRPGPSPSTGRGYLLAYRLLGFAGAEQVRARLTGKR